MAEDKDEPGLLSRAGDLLKRGAAALRGQHVRGRGRARALVRRAAEVHGTGSSRGPVDHAVGALRARLRPVARHTYIKQWGEKNDVQVKIDHINNALLEHGGRGGGGAEGPRPLPVPLPALGAGEAVDPAERRRPGGREEARQDDRRRLDVDVQPEDEAVLRLLGQLRARPDPVAARASGTTSAIAPSTLGQRPQGGAEAEGGRASGRARDVERARLEHVADVARSTATGRPSRTRRATRRSTTRARSRP